MNDKNFIVVRSSAGSGKTYTLVRRYLLMVFKSDDPRYFRRILAITFTNKATNEMKERIIQALNGISSEQDKYKELTRDLAETLQLSEESLISKAELVLKHLIHDYAEFAISTIDRFVYRIIRTFSFELSIPGNAEIELNKDRILHKSIDGMLAQLKMDSPLLDLLIEFGAYKFSKDKSFLVEHDLFQMSKEVIDNKASAFLKELDELAKVDFKTLKKAFVTKSREIEIIIKLKAKESLDLCVSNGLSEGDFNYGKSGYFGYIQKLSEKSSTLSYPGKNAVKVLDGGKWTGGKTSKEHVSIVEQISGELERLFKELIALLDQHWKSYQFCQIMLVRLHSMALVTQLRKEIQRYKSENDILQLDDFNTLISNLIDDNPVPYIFERSGEKFNHFLIDEFQDTSRIQWYNLLPLIENGLSEGMTSMLVGDAKQAIYRWRGGDVEQLGKLPKLDFENKPEIDVMMRQEVLEASYHTDHLESNFRSAENIVHFVNDFFEEVLKNYPDEANGVYFKHQQEVKNHHLKGSVDIQFLPPKTEDEERLGLLLEGIKKYTKLGYNYGDVTILCRKKAQCTTVANYLIQHEIPVISTESLKISSSKEVGFLLNWIRFLNEPLKPEHAFSILQFLVDTGKMGSMDNDALLKFWKEGKDLYNALEIHHPEFSVSSISAESLQEACTSLSNVFLSEKSTDPFVLNFIDQVGKFQSQWGNDPLEFLAWWEDKGLDIDVAMPEKVDSIRVMTIHKSKGLEFNVVILPFLFDAITTNEDSVWTRTREGDAALIPIAWLPMSKALEDTAYADLYQDELKKSFIDTLNLMYVAMTRAAHHLLILSENHDKKEDEFKVENLLWKCFNLKDYTGSSEEARFFKGVSDMDSHTKKEAESSLLIFSKVENVHWRQRIQLKYRMDRNILGDGEMSPREKGNLIHDILSNIEELDELQGFLNQYLLRGLITFEQKKILEENIIGTIENSELRPFFYNCKGLVYNERDLLNGRGELLRPDRMVIREEEVTLIDYKTGLPEETHESQMKAYRNVLKELGSWKVKTYLVYFSSGEIRQVA